MNSNPQIDATQEEWCPRCGDDVQVSMPWGKVKCPKCGLEGYWEEDCLEDLSECWPYIKWEEFK